MANCELPTTTSKTEVVVVATPAATTTDTKGSNSKNERAARIRWRLLKAALSGRPPDEKDVQKASIHRFGGFQLLPKAPITNTTQLSVYTYLCSSRVKDWKEILPRVLAIECCSNFRNRQEAVVDLSMDPRLLASITSNNYAINDDIETLLRRNEQLQKVREELSRRRIRSKVCYDSDKELGKLRISFPTAKDGDFEARDYDCFVYDTTMVSHHEGDHENTNNNNSNNNENDNNCNTRLLVREPSVRSTTASNRMLRLKHLASHQHHNGIDNTGNTQVWDSENTLAYLLQRILCNAVIRNNNNNTSAGARRLPLLDHNLVHAFDNVQFWNLLSSNNMSEEAPLRVTELGCGMAGLAGFVVAKALRKKTVVTLTDGHPDCVLNQLVHLQLNAGVFDDNVNVRKLPWSTRTDDGDAQEGVVDLVVCSDCTHFVEHHAALAITVATLLRTGSGIALFCQPHRGTSLQKFIKLLQGLNGLFQIQLLDQYDEIISRLHHEQAASSNDKDGNDETTTKSLYDPSIHYPRLLVLKKLGEVTDAHRIKAEELQQDCSSSS